MISNLSLLFLAIAKAALYTGFGPGLIAILVFERWTQWQKRSSLRRFRLPAIQIRTLETTWIFWLSRRWNQRLTRMGQPTSQSTNSSAFANFAKMPSSANDFQSSGGGQLAS